MARPICKTCGKVYSQGRGGLCRACVAPIIREEMRLEARARARAARIRPSRDRWCDLCGVSDDDAPWSSRARRCEACDRASARNGVCTKHDRPILRVSTGLRRFCPMCPGPGLSITLLVSPAGKERHVYVCDHYITDGGTATAATERDWTLGRAQKQHRTSWDSSEQSEARRALRAQSRDLAKILAAAAPLGIEQRPADTEAAHEARIQLYARRVADNREPFTGGPRRPRTRLVP